MGNMVTARTLRSIYQLKVTLKGCRPSVWRRLLIASTDNLEDVHIALSGAALSRDSLHDKTRRGILVFECVAFRYDSRFLKIIQES